MMRKTHLASPHSCIDNLCQGLTVTTDEAGKVIVARIIIDSVIERQGLLRPGDLILEANSVRVKTPEQLQNLIEDSPEFLSLKIQPTLSVSQSQPLNTASQEKSVTSLPNKVSPTLPSLRIMLTGQLTYPSYVYINLKSKYAFSIMFGACSVMIPIKTLSCLVRK